MEKLECRPRMRTDLIRREMDEEVLLYDPKHDRTHLLNPLAAAIWELCDGTRTAEEITQEILQALPAAREKVLSDVQRTLEQFTQKGLLIM